MSVLIKGMEMPTSCDDCDFVQHSYPEDWCYFTEKNLPCNCPLVPVPPHGRLIDADDFFRSFPELIPYEFAAPTIIPAEEGE